MDLKQEAQRIFERFYNETLSHLSDHNTKEDARHSALICIEEMQRVLAKDSANYLMYEDVKQEIKQL